MQFLKYEIFLRNSANIYDYEKLAYLGTFPSCKVHRTSANTSFLVGPDTKS